MAKKKGKRRGPPGPSRGNDDPREPVADASAAGQDPSSPADDEPEAPDPEAPDGDTDDPAPSSRRDRVAAAAARSEAIDAGAPMIDKLKADEIAPIGAAWAKPFHTFDRAWTWFEIRLLMLVVFGLVVSMVAWVVLKGMAEPLELSASDGTDGGGKAGTTVRCLLGMSVLGAVGFGAVRRWGKNLSPTVQKGIVAALLAVGAAAGPLWRAAGVTYAEQLLNWLQEGSSLTMFGGLRGVSTRLTILLALVGASLAAATGKHINIDVVVRFVPDRAKNAVLVVATVATMAVCGVASWGFFDYSSIDGFGAERHLRPGEKWDQVTKVTGQSLFLWRKQVGLDLAAAPRVLKGERWDEPGRMNGAQWNELIEQGGFRQHFTKEQVDALLAPQEALAEPRVPLVIAPDRSARGLMIPLMNLFFPIGFIILAIRFGVRCLLVLTGWHVDNEQGAGESEPIASEGA